MPENRAKVQRFVVTLSAIARERRKGIGGLERQ